MNTQLLKQEIKEQFFDEYFKKSATEKPLTGFLNKFSSTTVGVLGTTLVVISALTFPIAIPFIMVAMPIAGVTLENKTKDILSRDAAKMIEDDLAKGPDSVIAQRYKSETIPNFEKYNALCTNSVSQDIFRSVFRVPFNMSATDVAERKTAVTSFLTPSAAVSHIPSV